MTCRKVPPSSEPTDSETSSTATTNQPVPTFNAHQNQFTRINVDDLVSEIDLDEPPSDIAVIATARIMMMSY